MKKPQSNDSKNQNLINRLKKQEQDLELKKQLIAAPELFISPKGSDAHLDELALKVKLIKGDEVILSDIIANEMAEHETKFFKEWFYRLADIAHVSRSVMDVYVKPEFVRRFIIQFVYGRFPYMVLRTLRSRNRKKTGKRGKLFQHMTKKASDQLDMIISQVYTIMQKSEDIVDFKKNYSKEYQLYFQIELFE